MFTCVQESEGHLDMFDGLIVSLLKEKWKVFARFRFVFYTNNSAWSSPLKGILMGVSLSELEVTQGARGFHGTCAMYARPFDG